MTKTYYKVVKQQSFLRISMVKKVVITNLESYAFAVAHYDCGIEYKIGEWVYPQILGSYLYIFDNLDKAIAFSGKPYSFVHIFEVEVGLVKKPIFCHSLNCKDIQYFWKLYRSKKRYAYLTTSGPLGSLMTDKVKLIQEVEYK